MKRLITIFSLLFCMVSVNAQGIIKKVNDIKMSEEYIWAQYANPSPDSALVKAKEWLLMLVSEAEGRPVSMREISPYIRHIYLKGETVTRAFVYIKKTDTSHQIIASDTLNSLKPEENVFTPDSLTLSLMSLKDIYAARDYFDTAVVQGNIVRYGSPKEAETMDDKYLILFSQDNLAPICVLSPVYEGAERTNMVNGQNDSLDNYHGCYAVWYVIKSK